MRELAALRGDAERLKARSAPAAADAVGFIDRSLQVLERLRQEAATLQAECARLRTALGERDRLLGAFVHLVPLPTLITDRAGLVLDANSAAIELLGRSLGKLRNELLLHYAEDRAAFTAIVASLPALHDPSVQRLRIRPRERAPVEVSLTIVPDVRADGHFLWFFSRV